jgi:hypothetical protein
MRLYATASDVYEERKLLDYGNTNFVAVHDVPSGNL